MKNGFCVLFGAMAALYTFHANAATCDAETVAVAQARSDSQQWGVPTTGANFKAHDFGARGTGPATIGVVYSFDQAAHDGFPATSGEMIGIYFVDYATCKIVGNGIGQGMLQPR